MSAAKKHKPSQQDCTCDRCKADDRHFALEHWPYTRSVMLNTMRDFLGSLTLNGVEFGACKSLGAE